MITGENMIRILEYPERGYVASTAYRSDLYPESNLLLQNATDFVALRTSAPSLNLPFPVFDNISTSSVCAMPPQKCHGCLVTRL